MSETFSVDKDIFSVGTHNGRPYGGEVLDAMVKNFETLKEKDPSFRVPLKIDVFKFADDKKYHGGIPAFGWVQALKRVGDKVVATITDIPRKLKEIIDNKGYRQVSIELMEKFTHPSVGPLDNTLKAVALLGVDNPGCKTLDEVWRFYGQGEVPGQVISEFVVEDNTTKEEQHMTDKELQDLQARLATAEAEAKQFKDKTAQLEGDLKATKDAKTQADARVAELADGQRQAGIKVFVDARKAEGKILPAHEQHVMAVFAALDDSKTVEFAAADGKKEQKTVRALFEEMLNGLPNIVKFAEKAGTAKEETTFQAKPEDQAGIKERQELHFKATEYLKEHKDCSYRDALIAVSKPQQPK